MSFIKENKIALGSAQFGMNYGINNLAGRLSFEEIAKIVDYASNNGITCIDTAQAYGLSEEILGVILKDTYKFKIISKLNPSTNLSVIDSFNSTLNKLKAKKIYGFLYHHYTSFTENKKRIKEFYELKKNKKVEKIGFSLYYPHELEALFDNKIQIDLIQIPYNIFDRRFEYLFSEIAYRNIELHTRSVFLQGLVFIPPEKLNTFFAPLKNKLIELNNFAKINTVSIASICLNFVIFNNYISKIVIGVDSLNNLKENLLFEREHEKILKLLNKLDEYKTDDENMILPFNWKIQ